jgi:lysophospholipase L1-like esterase
MIHTFGDSHSSYGWNQIYPIQIHSFFGKLCYSFGRDSIRKFNIQNTIQEGTNLKLIPIEENDIIIFSFGEIDCRCHINKYITEDKSYQIIIDDIINKYFMAIEENVSQFLQLRVYVYNILPPNVILESEDISEDEDYKNFATSEIRKNYVLYFNKKLEEYCILKNYGFIDIYDQLADDNGYLKKSLSDNTFHMKNSSILLDYLKEYILSPEEYTLLRKRKSFIAIGDSHSTTSIVTNDIWFKLLSNYDDVWTNGILGHTTRDAINSINDILRDIKKFNNITLTILYGTNDVLNSTISLDEYKNNLCKIINCISEKLSNSAINFTIILITPPPLKRLHPQLFKHIRGGYKVLPQFVTGCIDVANNMNVLCYDLYNAFIQKKNWETFIDTDGIHLTEEGHYQFYNGLVDFLQIHSLI